MQVRDGMTPKVISVGPATTLRECAKRMTQAHVGATVVHDPDGVGTGILTERDILVALAAGADPDVETAGNDLTKDVVFAGPNWPLDKAAHEMLKGGFRHLIVVDEGEVVGMLSVRDVVRLWSAQRSDAAGEG